MLRINLRILSGVKHTQITLSRFQKVSIDIWVVETSNQGMQGYARLYKAILCKALKRK